jgi:arsenite methyltransferase
MTKNDRNEMQEQVQEAVRARYRAAARTVLDQGKGGSCSPENGCCDRGDGAIGAGNYDRTMIEDLPRDAVAASLGCGNPTALADLRSGETVLDLGSGGGIDVLLSARRVGPSGFAYGLDMTDEMLDLAERNRIAAGVENSRFLKGQIEDIPLPDASVDVIISNCVINLATDKDSVLREAFRVLRAGGRVAVSDIVVENRLAPSIRRNLAAWSACAAGALTEPEYRSKLAAAGFTDIALEVSHSYELGDLSAADCGGGRELSWCGQLGKTPGRIVSVCVRARKLAGEVAGPQPD